MIMEIGKSNICRVSSRSRPGAAGLLAWGSQSFVLVSLQPIERGPLTV